MKHDSTSPKTMTRRKFLKALIGGGILLGGGAVFANTSLYRETLNQARALSGDLRTQHLRQIVTANPSVSRTVLWQAEAPLSSPMLEYRIRGEEASTDVAAREDFFQDDGTANHQYAATLENLVPGTSYEYRIASGEHVSEWHFLDTPENGDFQCLIFPDSQSGDYSDWERLARDAAQRNPGAAFFINVGDIVDNGEDRSQWQAWLNAVEGIIDRIPFVPVMGNHETYDRNWQVRLPEAYLKYFVVPENGSRDFERYYYSFDWGDVHFVVLNSQWDETESFRPGLMEEQQDWLQKDVKGSARKWKIVLIHKDVLQYRIHGRPERKEGISDVGDAFMPIFDELGIDIVFTAHLHTYRDRGHIYNFRRDSRGPLYILTGVAGDVRYPGLWIDHALDETVAPQPETDNYITMDVAKDTITLKCFLPDGREIDRVSVAKA